MAKMNIGGVIVEVMTREEFPLEKAREVLKNETELEELSYSYDSMAIVKKMKDIVPEFISQHSIYEVLDLKNN